MAAEDKMTQSDKSKVIRQIKPAYLKASRNRWPSAPALEPSHPCGREERTTAPAGA
jgi:hypothetical protein